MSHSAIAPQSKAGWAHFPHDADVGVEGWGATVAEAFEQAAHALTAIITLEEVQPQVPVEVKCVEWLNATPEAQKPGGLPRP